MNSYRNKILLAIIAVLLLTNIVMLVLFFRMEKPVEEPKKPGFTERLKKEVGFTTEQMKIFEPKRDAYWKRMRERFDEIKKTKEEFYYQIYDPSIPDSVIEAKAEIIGRQQKELDLQMIRNFKEVRELATPDQLQKYDSLIPMIIERVTARPGRK